MYVAGLTPEGVHQAFHAQLMLHSQIARTAAVPLSSIPSEQLPTLPEPLQTHARHMWLTSAVDVHVSKLQSDVSNALLLAGIPNSMEWLTDDGLFSIDIAFQVDGQPVAVEVDGSHHYTISVPHMPLSEVLVRRRLLQVGVHLENAMPRGTGSSWATTGGFFLFLVQLACVLTQNHHHVSQLHAVVVSFRGYSAACP